MVAILNPVGPGSQIPIDRAVVLIGRSPECDVVLDVSSKISRLHCALVQVDTEYYIRDLGSMNGVTVSGQKVEKDFKLTNGAEVVIGDVKFQFLENVAVAPKATKQAPVAGRPMPALIDETAKVSGIRGNAGLKPDIHSMQTRAPGAGAPRRPLDVDEIDVIESEEIEVIEDIDVIEDVEVIEAVEVVDNIEVIEDIEVLEDVEILEDVEVLEDVEIIDVDDEGYRRPRRRR